MTFNKEKESLITQKRLKQILEYDYSTGEFKWLRNSSRAKIGSVAGFVNWKGYLLISISGVVYRAHRLAFLYMTGIWPDGQVDHIDHNKMNNAFNNLRIVFNKENHKNMRTFANNTSGYPGVCFHKKASKWMSYITVDNKSIYLGLFNKIDEAIAARRAANIKYGFHDNHGSRQ